MLDIYKYNKSAPPSIHDVIQATLKWHFSEETGSPFWLEKRTSLPFNPLHDIQTLQDLDEFPDYTEEMKRIPVEKLIPKGMHTLGWGFEVFESGGTTGSPQKIVDMLSRKKALEWVFQELNAQSVFENCTGHWLHVGPTGPHIVGRSIGRMATYLSKLCYYIDFDPRWVKKCSKNGEFDVVKAYIQHLLEQVSTVLETQNIEVLFATPALLEAMSNNEKLSSLIQKKIKVIIWAGTSIDEGTLDALETFIFPEARFIGLYGNTLMGIAPQRQKFKDDPKACVFQTLHPFSIVQLVDKENHRVLTPYNTYGQVKLTLFSPELFIPSRLERDQALRVAPVGSYTWDGVADVRPMENVKEKIFEGVY
ncbi:phenazine biosynthesis protein [Paenibacillus polymyxa]|nr:phenazine biosynthesis protein [Paenibacillus polymyxa]